MGSRASQAAEQNDIEMEALTGAVFAWCAERSVGLRTQAGVNAAGAAIDLFHSGFRTQEALFNALHWRLTADSAAPV